MWCRDGTRAIRDPVVSDIPVTYVRAQKRLALAPNTPKVARCSRHSVSRGPRALERSRSPQREGSKGKGKEVGEALTLKTGGPPAAGDVPPSVWQEYCGDDDDDGVADPADSSGESVRASPTPKAAKGQDPCGKKEKLFSTPIDPGQQSRQTKLKRSSWSGPTLWRTLWCTTWVDGKSAPQSRQLQLRRPSAGYRRGGS